MSNHAEFTLGRLDAEGAIEGPLVLQARKARIEVEVHDKLDEETFKRQRQRLARLKVGDGLKIEDPRACGGAWAVRRTA